MGKFKEKIYRFMYGRYGTDELYKFSMVVFFILWIAELILVAVMPEGLAQSIVSLSFSTAITLLLVWMIYRTMSRNHFKRKRENMIYLKASRAVKRCFSGNVSKGSKSRNLDDYAYIFRDCTKCGATLRLPRKSGKHSVKCPRCSHSFYVKSK